jgi:hypothetical protein
MLYNKATDELPHGVSQPNLAKALGVSAASIMEDHLNTPAEAGRSIVTEQIRRSRRLIADLDADRHESLPCYQNARSGQR